MNRVTVQVPFAIWPILAEAIVLEVGENNDQEQDVIGTSYGSLRKTLAFLALYTLLLPCCVCLRVHNNAIDPRAVVLD